MLSEPVQTTVASGGRTSPEGEREAGESVKGATAAGSAENERRCGAVQARWAVGADCCGALGCRESEALLSVVGDDGRRVLCPSHTPGWVRR